MEIPGRGTSRFVDLPRVAAKEHASSSRAFPGCHVRRWRRVTINLKLYNRVTTLTPFYLYGVIRRDTKPQI